MRLNMHMHAKSQSLALSEEVRAALREGRPVVALESTIITHGMPYPQNLQVGPTACSNPSRCALVTCS